MKYPITADLRTPDRQKAYKAYASKIGSGPRAAYDIVIAGMSALGLEPSPAKKKKKKAPAKKT